MYDLFDFDTGVWIMRASLRTICNLYGFHKDAEARVLRDVNARTVLYGNGRRKDLMVRRVEFIAPSMSD